MKYANKIGAGVVLALMLAASAARAHEGMHGPGGEYDDNGDESLSLAEYTVYLKDYKLDVSTAASRFASLDSNKDGKLSSAEFIRGLNPEKAK
jgi:hypothetical protein